MHPLFQNRLIISKYSLQGEVLLDSDVLNLTSPNEYEVSWYLPEDNGVLIEYFEISAYPVRWQDSTLSWTRIRNAPLIRYEVPHPGNVRYLVTGLYPDTHYTIEIRAQNALGYSQASSITIKTARGKIHSNAQNLIFWFIKSLGIFNLER